MRALKSKSQYEFLIKEVTTSYNSFTLQFLQDNMYNQNPYGNNYKYLSGNFSFNYGTSWYGLALGTYGQTDMQNNCTLATSAYGNSWWNCLQQNASQGFGTGPWQLGYNGLSVSIFQR